MRLVNEVGRQLEGHGAAGEVALLGQVNTTEGAPADLFDELEPTELAARLGECGDGSGWVAGDLAVTALRFGVVHDQGGSAAVGPRGGISSRGEGGGPVGRLNPEPLPILGS
jgi:hypothetical protein